MARPLMRCEALRVFLSEQQPRYKYIVALRVGTAIHRMDDLRHRKDDRAELLRTRLLGTWVNKGKKKG